MRELCANAIDEDPHLGREDAGRGERREQARRGGARLHQLSQRAEPVWAEQCGFRDAQLEKIRKGLFGRLAMLAHAGCDDPDRLLSAAQMNAGWWAADDSYADDSESGAIPEKLPPRLSFASCSIEPEKPALRQDRRQAIGRRGASQEHR